MPVFKTLTKSKLRILTGFVIRSLIVTITKIYIRVRTSGLIKGLISRKYGYSHYCRAVYFK